MSETPIRSDIFDSETGEYDEHAGEVLSQWCFDLLKYQAAERERRTREGQWDKDWQFIGQNKQWEGPLPTYRRPITANIWRRSLHVLLSVLMGGRPMLKLIPQGIDTKTLEVWQHALWSLMRKESVTDKLSSALSWALVQDGGWIKVGYGARDPLGQEQPDVMISSPHPSKIYPDSECTDIELSECGMILFRDYLDVATITRRYPQVGWRVNPESSASEHYASEVPDMAKGQLTIAPAGGWTMGLGMKRARAEVVEVWIDDPALMMVERDETVNLDAAAMTPEVRKVKRWVPKYPYGRVITASQGVVLRDIQNPYGKAFGWKCRYPFVYVPGADMPNTLWRLGLCGDLGELSKAVNKSLSLVLENSIKVTNAMVIADEMAMDDEDWDFLSLFPGCKIRKRAGTDVKVTFPQPLPPQAFQLPDFLIRKMEEVMGLHDPPITPGQAVAAKTVDYMQRKGSFLLGRMSTYVDSSLERLGTRIVGLQRDRYLPGRQIEYFSGEKIQQAAPMTWPDLPASAQVRVDAGSAWQEIMATAMAQAAQQKGGRK
jgi:hypothetical protein